MKKGSNKKKRKEKRNKNKEEEPQRLINSKSQTNALRAPVLLLFTVDRRCFDTNDQLSTAADHPRLQLKIKELRAMDEAETSRVEVYDLEMMHSDEDGAKELASKLREIVSVKRQLDVPSQAELIQYERRFAELNVQIQGKLWQTRKCYATFNALMEIKELMLKETSLLNSISSQFQDAISSPAGRMKLIDSMEAILKGTQQKQEKVQRALQAGQKICDDLREKYAAAISEQRRCSSLLKAFQEVCTKNDELRNLVGRY